MNFYFLRFIFFFLLSFSLVGCGGGGGDDTSLVSQDPVTLPVDTVEIVNTEGTVQQTLPLNLARNVEVNSSIEVQLSTAFNIENIQFELKEKGSGTIVDGSLTSNNQTLLFELKSPLNYAREYSVNISSALTSSLVLEPYSFSFETEAAIQRENGSLHPPIKGFGQTTFSIIPIESVKVDTPTKVTFGIPFPKDYLVNIDEFKLIDETGEEINTAVKELLVWRDSEGDAKSIRSALVQLELEFHANQYGTPTPRELTLVWGMKRKTNNLLIESPRNSWVLVDDEEFLASDEIYEPQAYALFEPEWYGDCVIKTRLLPLNNNPDFSAYDAAFKLFGDTAINQVDPRVIDDNLIPYRDSYAAWLFDRAMTIYQLAFRTGEFAYLRAAHRASQFYLQHINEQGYFSLKPSNDMKYSYGESLVAEYILFGDERISDTVKNMVPAWDSFDSNYKITTNFWTERHAAFQLKGYVSAYELLGNVEYKAKAQTTFANLSRMQLSPDDGVPNTGALMHTSSSHGEGGANFIASPWMSALLIDAVERYSIHIEEDDISDFVIKMAKYFQQEDIALYEWTGYLGKDRFFAPHYLAGAGLTDAEHGGIGLDDLEHGIDVNKIFSAAYFHSCALGSCDNSFLITISRLNTTAYTQTVPYWIRPAAPSSSLSSYRLAPPRKFNWWFNITANNDFLLGDNVTLPIYEESTPLLKLTQNNVNYSSFKPGDEIRFSFQLENIGSIKAKNIVIKASTLVESPEGLLEINAISKDGANRSGEIIWHIESLEPNQTLSDFSFIAKVNDFPVLQTYKRPIGNILSFAEVNYCDQADTIDKCPLWVNVWSSGEQTFKTQSNWIYIAPISPVTSPVIEVISPIDFELISGKHNVIAEIEDEDGIAKVEFSLDGEVVETLSLPPYQTAIQFDSLSSDPHELIVKAWDVFGSEASKRIIIDAKNPDSTAPKVTIISPVQAQEYCNSVDIKYEVEDEFSIKSCQISLNGKSISAPNCGELNLTNVVPLFSAKAHLPLDDVSDIIESTNKYALVGSLKGASWSTTTSRSSLSFSGIDQYVDFTTTDLDINNNVTASFWINPQADEGVIMSQDWGYIGYEYGWAISIGANNHLDNNLLAVTWSSGTNTSNLNEGNVIQTPPYSISLNQWQQVVIRKQNKQVDIFINGILVTSEQLIDGAIAWPFASEKKFNIGKAMVHPDMYNSNYHGLLDDIAIWNEALSDDEISLLHGNQLVVNTQHLTVSAQDNAGNIGSAMVSFDIKSCD